MPNTPQDPRFDPDSPDFNWTALDQYNEDQVKDTTDYYRGLKAQQDEDTGRTFRESAEAAAMQDFIRDRERGHDRDLSEIIHYYKGD